MAAAESGLDTDELYREEDIFELQHHHLLRCLEKTTVSRSLSHGGETFFCPPPPLVPHLDANKAEKSTRSVARRMEWRQASCHAASCTCKMETE